MTSIAIILPAYNEEMTIEETIRSFSLSLPKAKIVVVDNNSEDKTSEITKKTFKKLKLNKRALLLFEPRQGKASALRNAFIQVEADIYIISDADMTYPADQVHKLIHPILSGDAEMVIGDRHSLGFYKKHNKRPFHNFGNSLINIFVNTFFHSQINDVMSGYRSLSRRLVKSYPVLIDGFEIETDLTIFALDKNFKIMEVPIPYKDRPTGSISKLNTFKDGVKVLLTIIQTLRFYKPLFFFTCISFLFLALSLFTGLPVIKEYIFTGTIHHVPLAILSSAIMILSMISLSIGIILDSIRHQNNINFELRSIDFVRKKNNL